MTSSPAQFEPLEGRILFSIPDAPISWNLSTANNTIETAKKLGRMDSFGQTIVRNNDVGATDDLADHFRFTAGKNFRLRASVTGLSADADVQLLRPGGKVVDESKRNGTTDELLKHNLKKGRAYLIKVVSYDQQLTDYQLRLKFQHRPAASNIPTKFAGYEIQVSEGGVYQDDAFLGLVLVKGIAGATGAFVVSPTLSAQNKNGRNARDLGLYISDDILSELPGLGPAGDLHFSTNTSLDPGIGVHHASTLLGGAVDETPLERDVVFMEVDEQAGVIDLEVDENSQGSTGQRNWFIKGSSIVTTNIGPLPIEDGEMHVEFSANKNQITGTAFFKATAFVGLGVGEFYYYVTFSGVRAQLPD